MGEAVKIGFISAGIWILGKMVMYFIDPLMNVTPAIYLNIFLLLGSIAFGLYRTMLNETEESNALNDIKNGMKAGLSYASVVALFIYIFYAFINPDYNEYRIARDHEQTVEILDDEEKFAQIKKMDGYEVMTKEEIIQQKQEAAEAFYSAGATFTISVLGMLLLSTLYSILVSLILRKVVFKRT